MIWVSFPGSIISQDGKRAGHLSWSIRDYFIVERISFHDSVEIGRTKRQADISASALLYVNSVPRISSSDNYLRPRYVRSRDMNKQYLSSWVYRRMIFDDYPDWCASILLRIYRVSTVMSVAAASPIDWFVMRLPAAKSDCYPAVISTFVYNILSHLLLNCLIGVSYSVISVSHSVMSWSHCASDLVADTLCDSPITHCDNPPQSVIISSHCVVGLSTVW